jgi:5-methylcytosine-specific restriction endonuclease McrA
MIEGKKCAKCKEWKPFVEFYKHAAFKDGRQYACISCCHEYAKQYYAANRDKELARSTARQKIHRAEASAASKRWRVSHPEEVKEFKRNRRALQYDAPGTVPSREEISRLREDSCVYCGSVAGTVDHLIPLTRWKETNARDITGVANLVGACVSCNCQKRNRLLSEWDPFRVLRAMSTSPKVLAALILEGS